MIEQYATSDCLSCLLNSHKDLEQLPEPFRMQGNVTFRVTPSAYTEFVLALTTNSNVQLMTKLDVLQGLASVGSPKLYNCFLADIAFSIMKELSYAEMYNNPATIILPTSPQASNVYASNLIDSSRRLTHEVEVELWSIVVCRGFELPPEVSVLNVGLYKTAVALYYLSKRTSAVKEVNLLYDCPR